jgi:hypothetical protein
MKKILLLFTNISILVLICSIYPKAQIVNLAFENAQSLGTGNFDIKGMYSHQSFRYEGSSEKLGDLYGGELGMGVSRNIDVKFRYEALAAPKGMRDYTVNYYSLVPKISIKKDVFSFMLPVSAYTAKQEGERATNYSIAPCLLGSLPAIPNKVDVTFAAKGDFMFFQGGGDEQYLGFNLGADLSSNLKRWSVRPEASYLFHPGDKGAIWTVGVGLQVLLSR